MEKALLAALERANDLIQRQGKALEEQRTINERSMRACAHLDARFTAASHVIKALIKTHPDCKTLHEAWKPMAEGEMRQAKLHIPPNLEDIYLQTWFSALEWMVQIWEPRLPEQP